MGKDGKPYFFAGPYDSAAKSNQILAKLRSHFGPDGFYYTVPVAESDLINMQPIDDDEDYDDDEFDDGFDDDYDDEPPRLWNQG
jgi:hypothetical protein